MILTEELQFISPQEARDKGLFGPVYHGTTNEDRLEKIKSQGFKITVGNDRTGDTSNGYELMDYWAGVPAPIHHLGFGVYFTTIKSIAKKFSYGNSQIGPYFLDAPRLEIINFGSKKNMMNWWVQNGYDYDRQKFLIWNNNELRYGNKTEGMRQERLRATLNLTETLKSKYDAVWFKGKGIYQLLDGDQVVVFDPNGIYKLDKSLSKPGEIGSKVVARVNIDLYSRGEITIPIGTKGIIIDKKKPVPEQKWAEGSEYIYAVKWERGGTMYNVINPWIDIIYTKTHRKKLGEEIKEKYIQRRNFWKVYEEIYKLNENNTDWHYEKYLPISKFEEDQVVNVIKNHFVKGGKLERAVRDTLKKVRDVRKEKIGPMMEFDVIDYQAEINGHWITFHIRKTNKGVGYSIKNNSSNKVIDHYDYKIVIPPEQMSESVNIKEGKDYYPISKLQEQWAVKFIISKLKPYNENVGKYLKKTDEKRHVNDQDIYTDVLTYVSKCEDERISFWIKTTKYGLIYNCWSNQNRDVGDSGWIPIGSTYIPEVGLNESDDEHAETIKQTGYWGKQGAGAIILAKDTGRILLPYRSRYVLQPNTWGVWGGAIDDNENPASAVRKELLEEVGYNLQIDELIPLYVFEDTKIGFKYHNFLAIIDSEFIPKLNWETEKAEWISFETWPKPLHFGLKILLDRSYNEIKNEVKKYVKVPTSIKTKKIDREKFKAAMEVIRATWTDMIRSGDSNNRFDFENHFQHWMYNNEKINNGLLIKYGKIFYPNDEEGYYTFAQEDVSKVLDILEQRYYKKITRKIDKNDPLYFLKQVVQKKSWNSAKKSLQTLMPNAHINEFIPDDVAESIFNRLYRLYFGETFFDANKFHNAIRLNRVILTSESDKAIEMFVHHYNGKNMDRFPDEVKVWRGVPSPTVQIRPGDFITFDRKFARGYSADGKYGAVISNIIPSKDLLLVYPNVGASELIYWPEGHQIKKYSGPIPKFKDFYLQYK